MALRLAAHDYLRVVGEIGNQLRVELRRRIAGNGHLRLKCRIHPRVVVLALEHPSDGAAALLRPFLERWHKLWRHRVARCAHEAMVRPDEVLEAPASSALQYLSAHSCISGTA